MFTLCEIRDSHGVEYEVDSLLRPSSGQAFIALKIDAVCKSETSVYSSETTRHYIPEDSHLYIHTRRRENLESV
jgi:hypothetical protein